MMDSLRPYPAYKDSGLPWLGRVPAHWEMRRGKFLFRYKKVLNADRSQKNVLSLTLRGVVNNDPNNPEGLVPKDYGTYQFFSKGDLVFKLIDLENLRTSRVGLVHEDGIMSPAYVRLVTLHNGLQKFFYQQYFDLYQRGIFNQLGAGVRSTLGPQDLLNLGVCLPSAEEQAAIVRYLDHATRKIDQAIRAKRKVIALLNEQKQAIIHRAVTRGLDPDVPLKDSGIPWLGQIPAHWELVRNLALFSQRVEKGIPGLPVLQVSLRSGITSEELDQFGRPKRLIADHTKYKLVRAGDLAYNTMRMWQGAVGTSNADGLVSPAYVVLRPREHVVSAFYELIFRTPAYMQEVNRYSTGIVSDRNRLYWETFKQMPNIWLPEDEQTAICALIRKETEVLDVGRYRIENEIDLLREYRTRLIADVVTGKLDVHEAAAQLPEPEVEEAPEAIEVEDDGEALEDAA